MKLHTANRLMSFISAAIVTAAMLASVNLLATAETGSPLWAHAAAAVRG